MQPSSTSSSEPRAALVSLAVCALALVGADLTFRASALGISLRRESWYIVRPKLYSDDARGADVVGIGDSRLGCSFNPFTLERFVEVERGEHLRAWNAALPGAPPMAHLAWVRRALTHPHPPRMVILALSPYMFSSHLTRAPSREALTSMYRARDVPWILAAGGSPEDGLAALQADLFASFRVRPRLVEVLTDFAGLRETASVGDQGYEDHPQIDLPQQQRRAANRVQSYRGELLRANARFGSEQQGYFLESLRLLRDHHVTTVVLDSVSASQMDAVMGPDSIYPEHIAWVRAQAAAYGAHVVDGHRPPVLQDGDFCDVDHVSSFGAIRFTSWLTHEHLIAIMGGRRDARPAACSTVFDLDDESMPGWRREGSSMSSPITLAARRTQQVVAGYTGHGFLTTFPEGGGDVDRGRATSPPFVLTGDHVRVRLGGGSVPGLAVRVVVEGRSVAEASGRNDETLRDVELDVRAFRGRAATIVIDDEAAGGWGHLNVDDVAVCP